jgi:hypothetical protein
MSKLPQSIIDKFALVETEYVNTDAFIQDVTTYVNRDGILFSFYNVFDRLNKPGRISLINPIDKKYLDIEIDYLEVCNVGLVLKRVR